MIDARGRADADLLLRERALLYVTVTRVHDVLALTCLGAMSSSLEPLTSNEGNADTEE